MMKLQEVILKVMAKKLTWIEAAEIAGMSVRNMQRKRQAYQDYGYNGLFDRRRGKNKYHRSGASIGATTGLVRSTRAQLPEHPIDALPGPGLSRGHHKQGYRCHAALDSHRSLIRYWPSRSIRLRPKEGLQGGNRSRGDFLE